MQGSVRFAPMVCVVETTCSDVLDYVDYEKTDLGKREFLSALTQMGRRHPNILSLRPSPLDTKEFQSVLDLLSREESCPSSAKMRKGDPAFNEQTLSPLPLLHHPTF